MAVFSFSSDDSDVFWVRNGLFRMILSRAEVAARSNEDIEELKMASALQILTFDDLDAAQRQRIFDLVFAGTQKLRQDIENGIDLEEGVRGGVQEMLDGLIKFLSDHSPK